MSRALSLRSFLIGSQHRYYAMVAAWLALFATIFYAFGGCNFDQFTKAMVVYLMMFFASTVAAIAYGASKPEIIGDEYSIEDSYWHYGRYLYVIAVAAGILHLILFNRQTAIILQICGIAASTCLLPAIAHRLRSRIRVT